MIEQNLEELEHNMLDWHLEGIQTMFLIVLKHMTELRGQIPMP